MQNLSLRNDGFAIFGGLVDSNECDELAVRVEGIGNRSAGCRRLLEHGWCRELAARLQERLAGDLPAIGDATVVQCTYFHKTDERNWLVPWHQDRSVPVARRVEAAELSGWSHKEGMTFVHAPDDVLAKMVAVRLHLDASTAENGPLRVVPGSHRHGTLLPEQIEKARGNSDETTCLVPQRGVLAMRPLLLHASSKSSTSAPRRVLHFLFGPTQLPYGMQWRRTNDDDDRRPEKKRRSAETNHLSRSRPRLVDRDG